MKSACSKKEQKEVINRIESLKKQIDWYTAEDQLAGELTNGENILAKAKETFESLKELRSRLSFHDAKYRGCGILPRHHDRTRKHE